LFRNEIWTRNSFNNATYIKKPLKSIISHSPCTLLTHLAHKLPFVHIRTMAMVACGDSQSILEGKGWWLLSILGSMNFKWVWMANVWPNLIPNAQITFSFFWFVHFHMSMRSTLRSLSYSYLKALSHPFNAQCVELKKVPNAFKSFVMHCIEKLTSILVMTSFWGCMSLNL
jgi:hypothetical protein